MRVEIGGQVLEFPDDMEDSAIDATVRREMGVPEGGGPPISTLAPPTTEPPTMRIGPPVPPVPPAEPIKPLGERILEEVPQVGGGVVGGVAAATGGAGLLPIVAAVGVGAATGEAYKQIGQQLSGSLDAPKTSLDAAKRIGKAGLTEAGWEMVGGLAVKGFGKIIAPLKKKVIGEAIEAVDLFKDKLKPIVLLPAEATESRVLDLLQNVSESSIVGGASIQNYKTGRIKFFDDFADSLIDEFGKRTDPTDLGNLFVTSISNSRAVHSKAAKILYNSVDNIISKSRMSTLKPLRKGEIRIFHGSGKSVIKDKGLKWKGGIGLHLSSEPEEAMEYAMGWGGRERGFLSTINIKPEKFLHVGGDTWNSDRTLGYSFDDWSIEAVKQRLIDVGIKNVSSVKGSKGIFKLLRDNGYDGLKYNLENEFKSMGYIVDISKFNKKNPAVSSISKSRGYTDDIFMDKVTISLQSAKNFAHPLQKRAMKLEGIEAKNAGDDLVNAIMDLPDQLSYKEATELRSRLISRIDEFSILNKKAPAIGKAKKMVGLLDKAIEKSLKGIGEVPAKIGKKRATITVKRGIAPLPEGLDPSIRDAVDILNSNGIPTKWSHSGMVDEHKGMYPKIAEKYGITPEGLPKLGHWGGTSPDFYTSYISTERSVLPRNWKKIAKKHKIDYVEIPKRVVDPQKTNPPEIEFQIKTKGMKEEELSSKWADFAEDMVTKVKEKERIDVGVSIKIPRGRRAGETIDDIELPYGLKELILKEGKSGDKLFVAAAAARDGTTGKIYTGPSHPDIDWPDDVLFSNIDMGWTVKVGDGNGRVFVTRRQEEMLFGGQIEAIINIKKPPGVPTSKIGKRQVSDEMAAKVGKKRATITLKSGKKITVGKDWNTAGFAVKTANGKVHKVKGAGEADGGDLFHFDIMGHIAYGKNYKKGSAATPFVEGKEAARKQFVDDVKKIKDTSDAGYIDSKGNFISRSEIKGIMEVVGKLKGAVPDIPLRPAMKAKGKIYTGETHFDALNKIKGSVGKVDSGYINGKGKWVSPAEATEKYGYIDEEELGRVIRGEKRRKGPKVTPSPAGPTPSVDWDWIFDRGSTMKTKVSSTTKKIGRGGHTVYHGRSGGLTKESRHTQLGVHFATNKEVAEEVGLMKMGDSTSKQPLTVTEIELDPKDFIELTDDFSTPNLSGNYRLGPVKDRLKYTKMFTDEEIDKIKSVKGLWNFVKKKGFKGLQYDDCSGPMFIVEPEQLFKDVSIPKIRKRVTITSAATKNLKTDRIGIGDVHEEAIEKAGVNWDTYNDKDYLDGFMTSDGKFVNRKEALKIAKEAKQVDQDTTSHLLQADLDEFAGKATPKPVFEGGKKITPVGPTPYEAWRNANRFYKDGQKKFNSTLIRRLVKLADDTGTGAEMIAPAIFKPRHISSVRKIKAALLGETPSVGPPTKIIKDDYPISVVKEMFQGKVNAQHRSFRYGKGAAEDVKGGYTAAWGDDHLLIFNLRVHPAFRGKGYMDSMLNDAIKLAKNQNKTKLWLEPETNKLTSTYKKRGFIIDNKLTKKYNRTIMTMDIDSMDDLLISGKTDEGARTWRKMQGFFMQHFLQKSSNVNKEIQGKLLLNNISGKPGSFGMPMMKEVFTEPQIKALRAFGQAVKLTQEKQAQGTGRILIQLTQAGAMGAVLTGNLALPAATIIIAPAVMSKMMLNPRIAKLLTTGLTLPAKSPEAMGVLTRLTAAAIRINQGEENEINE